MSSSKNPSRQDRARTPVRVGGLEKYMLESLSQFERALNADFGQKTALLVSEFHKQVVDPRMARLERLPWNRFGLWLAGVWAWFVAEATERWDRHRGVSSPAESGPAEVKSPEGPA